MEKNVYIFKVIQNKIWDFPKIRGMPTVEIAVPENSTLYQLAETILEAFDFDFDHMVGFSDNWKNNRESKECYELFIDEGMDGFPNCKGGIKKTHLKKFFKTPKQRALMLFDYGDEWHFIIDFKKIEKAKENEEYPKILKREGKPFPQYEYDEDDEAL